MTNFDSTPYLLCRDCGEHVIESEADGHDCPKPPTPREPGHYEEFWNYYPHSHVQLLMLEAKSDEQRSTRLRWLSEGLLKFHLLVPGRVRDPGPDGCFVEKEAYAAYQKSLRVKPSHRGKDARSTKEKE